MIRLFRKIRNQLLSENNYPVYLLYALGEVLLVVVGILLALAIDNWNDRRKEKKVEIDNIESLYFSLNEDTQIEGMRVMFEFALHGEQQWIDYLEGKAPYSDSLLYFGYYIGSTSFLEENSGFYESLKMRGLETIDDEEIRLRLSVIYEQNLPGIQKSMENFMYRFGEERVRHFKKYFVMGSEFNLQPGWQYFFDYSNYRIESIINREEMMEDSEFLEFIKISSRFHAMALYSLERILHNIKETQNRIYYELNYLKYGSPERKKITFELNDFQDAGTVYISGEFNNWSHDEHMLRTVKGWERSYELFPGTYEYKFVVNGDHWIVDPANPDSVFVPEANAFNSVLKVGE